MKSKTKKKLNGASEKTLGNIGKKYQSHSNWLKKNHYCGNTKNTTPKKNKQKLQDVSKVSLFVLNAYKGFDQKFLIPIFTE